jgi:hypothetical protein
LKPPDEIKNLRGDRNFFEWEKESKRSDIWNDNITIRRITEN